jgi:molybdenum cofactor cytidylyltransferase
MNKTNIDFPTTNSFSAFSVQRSKIGLIVLAAGASSRMKSTPKQLLEFRGKTLLRHASETALASLCHPVCVVLGANAEKLRTEIIDLPIKITVNQNWERGLSASLQAGLQGLLKVSPEIGAVCVMLADQPLITSGIINNLKVVFERGENPLVVCEYTETTGVPVILARSLFGEIWKLKDDTGAKKIIQKHSALAAKLFVPEAALDVDSWDDYEKLKAIEKAEAPA